MSEVLIRMKMPKCCEECQFFAWKRGVGQYCAIDDRITFYATLDGFDVGYERNGDCPLVPVPPHGRLIDADEADSRYVPDFTDLTDFQCGWNEAMKRVCDESPTIIPAEEGE